jgi:hypothetical protein
VAPSRVPGWPELVIQMRLADPPPLRATVLTRTTRREVNEETERLFYRPPHDVRVEDGAGMVRSIHTAQDDWFVRQGIAEHVPRTLQDEGWQHPLLRPAPDASSFTDRTDVHRVTDGPRAATRLGRPAWQVTLAPTPHKPLRLTLWIDQQYGFLLQLAASGERNGGHPSELMEFTELELEVDLDDELCHWNGPVDDSWARRHEQQKRAEEYLRQQPPTVPRYWPSGMSYMLAEADPAVGSWMVDLDVGGDESGQGSWARLDRRPLRHQPYPGREGHVHRWTDERWQWALETEHPLPPDELNRVIDSIPGE